MKIGKTLFAAVLASLALVSCDSSSNKNELTAPYQVLNYTRSTDGECYSIGTTTYVLNFTTPTESSFRAAGVKFADGNSVDYNFTNMSLTGNKDAYVLSTTASTTPQVSSFRAVTRGYNINNASYNFISNEGSVVGLSTTQYFFSTTNVTEVETGKVVMNTNTVDKNRFYWIIQSKGVDTPSRTLDLYIEAASFIEGMPAINMVFKGINFSIQNDRIVLSKDELTPESVSGTSTVPQERFKIKDFNGSVLIGDNGAVSFVCSYQNREGKVVPYRVQSVICNYLENTNTGSGK